MYTPISKEELSPIIDYSIHKRYKEYPCSIENNYTNENFNMTILQLTDWIMRREPIVTSAGTMFKKRADTPNPMATVIQQFLDARSIHKKEMFKYPKGSEEFEHYNLLQQLDKIDVNGLYGTIGMYTSLIYNVNVATSVTSMGRSAVSRMSLCFESFLANNVKFGSLNEVLQFIDNIVQEKPKRKYKDNLLLDSNIKVNDCFGKIILSCGYRWIPNDNEMEIIYKVINNLNQEDINRVYYKNNLYEFMNNSSMRKALITIMESLQFPYLNPLNCPKEIKPMCEELADILMEYVFYGYMYIDCIDRCDNMIKSICMISDTDSTIISLDAWYHFGLNVIKDANIGFAKWAPQQAIYYLEKDEFGDYTEESKELMNPIFYYDPEYDYDFENDELIELKHVTNPIIQYSEDNVRYSLINIMAFILDTVINAYMEKFTQNNHSYEPGRKCRMIAKNEFLRI